MAATTHHITIEQGTTWSLQLRWLDADRVPIDLTTYTARMQVRRKHTSTTAMLDLTSGDGEITLSADGTIEIHVTDEQSAAMTAARNVYDLELVSADGTVTRLIEGYCTVTPEATR